MSNLKDIKDLVGQEECKFQIELNNALSKGYGREVKSGNTGRFDGLHIFDKDE